MNAFIDIDRQTTDTPTAAGEAVLGGGRTAQGGFAILHGSLAPEGCVVRLEGFSPDPATRTCRIFGHTEAAQDAILNGDIAAGDIIVMRSASNEALAAIVRAFDVMGLPNAILTDSRINAQASSRIIGNVAPSAAAGGPIARIEDGDLIHIDITTRHIDLAVAEPAAPAPVRHGKVSFGALEKYARLVSSTPHDH